MAYCDADDVKTYLGITSSGDDALIAQLIGRAQKAIDTHTRRTFEASSDTSRTFDAIRDVDGDVLYLDADLASITSITNGDGNTVSSSNYTTEPRNETPYYAIRLKENSTVSWTWDGAHEDAITVTGKWAYSSEAPADIVMACIEIAALYYRLRDTNSDLGRTVVTPTATLLPQGLSQLTRMSLDSYRKVI